MDEAVGTMMCQPCGVGGTAAKLRDLNVQIPLLVKIKLLGGIGNGIRRVDCRQSYSYRIGRSGRVSNGREHQQ